jgi:hypothetical protein
MAVQHKNEEASIYFSDLEMDGFLANKLMGFSRILVSDMEFKPIVIKSVEDGRYNRAIIIHS